MKKNDIICGEITALSAEGRGVARLGGAVCFVEGGAPGDMADIRILKAAKNCLYGKIERLITPSPHRVENHCPAFPRCGGCDFRHIDYETELAAKVRRVTDAFARIGGISIAPEAVLGAKTLLGYRNKAQYPLAMENGRAVYGFYRKNSHQVVPITRCLCQSALTDEIAGAVAHFITEHALPVYDEVRHEGIFRHVIVKQAFGTGEAMVVLAAAQKPPMAEALAAMLQARFPAVVSVYASINPCRTNVIMGEDMRRIAGRDSIVDTLGHISLHIGPAGFYQVNREQTVALYTAARQYAGGGGRLLDLYCGVGSVGLFMADGFDALYGVEIVAEAIDFARRNAAENGIKNARFFQGDAADAAALFEGGFDAVVVDPPRKGLSASVIGHIAAMAPRRLVYISCDPATLARDCRLLAAAGYAPQRLTICDLFPRTAHVESVVLLQRQ